MADIELVIKIPEKEFGIDIYDKFQDFFSRLKVEIKAHLITNTSLVCGAYELETIDMFLKTFNDSVPLPKGHGRLGDLGKIYVELNEAQIEGTPEYKGIGVAKQMICDAKTIVEAESEGEEH